VPEIRKSLDIYMCKKAVPIHHRTIPHSVQRYANPQRFLGIPSRYLTWSIPPACPDMHRSSHRHQDQSCGRTVTPSATWLGVGIKLRSHTVELGNTVE